MEGQLFGCSIPSCNCVIISQSSKVHLTFPRLLFDEFILAVLTLGSIGGAFSLKSTIFDEITVGYGTDLQQHSVQPSPSFSMVSYLELEYGRSVTVEGCSLLIGFAISACFCDSLLLVAGLALFSEFTPIGVLSSCKWYCSSVGHTHDLPLAERTLTEACE